MQKTNENSFEQIRVAIQREFLERCRKNPAYSLRAFAKYLDVDQSYLSKILKGQRPITADMAKAVGPKLGLKSEQLKALFKTGMATIPGFLPLSDDEFEVLSEWSHFAILELAKTENFENEPNKIALRLGLHVEEVRAALDRLERLGFISVTNSNIKILSPNNTWSNNQKTSDAKRKLQRDLIEKSIYAIDHIPFELRDNGSLTVAINPDRLPEFKEKLREFRKELAQLFQASDEDGLREVYQLTTALFPLTKINKHTGEQNENN